MYAKDQYLIKKRDKVDKEYLKDPKEFIDYSNDMQDVYKNIDEYNFGEEHKILIVFGDIIVDIINKTKLNSIVAELFIRGRRINISLVFITQSYLKVPKDARINTTHFFIMKIPNKREFQEISINHSSD